MAACLPWHIPAVTATAHISHGCSAKNGEVAFSLRHMQRYMVKNQRSPERPSSMRPMREYWPVMRASCPSALSKELAHMSSSIPATLIHILLK